MTSIGSTGGEKIREAAPSQSTHPVPYIKSLGLKTSFQLKCSNSGAKKSNPHQRL